MNDVLSPCGPPFYRDYAPQLLTAADVERLPADLPSGPVRYELHHGVLIVRAPPADVHGAVDGNLIAALKVQGEFAGHGRARSEVGVLLASDPDHLLGPDAAFISNARLPLRHSPQGYLLTIPDLIVEVRSPNETHAALGRKAEDYLNAGAAVVWVVDPVNRDVLEYRAGVAPHTYGEADTLTIEDVIPGFALPVAAALQV